MVVDILYTEAIEAVKLRAALSTSSPELIRILAEINSEARFCSGFQPVDLSTWSE
jgi:hypothetical protein